MRRPAVTLVHVREGRDMPRPYGIALFAFCSNTNSRAGVTGYSVMRTPNGESALSMAETMAAAAGTQPDSPTPFTPRGLSGEGHCTKLTSTFGTSVALASRYSAKLVVTGCAWSS